ncbi:MAG: DUF2500 family protein [Planctomycetes bacterium]|nr:DUF2500 family protein [Planctomycetota bacterium]
MEQVQSPRECPSCGARPDVSDGALRCAFCGTPFRPAAPVALPATPSSSEVRSDRLRRVRASPQYEQLSREVPSAAEFRNSLVAQGVFGAFFAGFAVFFMAVALGGMRGAGAFVLPFVLVPGLFLVIGGTLVVKSVQSVRKLAEAPLRTKSAIVIGKREQRSGKRNRTLTCYVTLETEEGRRVELKVPDRVYGLTAFDDAGIAWMKDEFLLDFRPIDV